MQQNGRIYNLRRVSRKNAAAYTPVVRTFNRKLIREERLALGTAPPARILPALPHAATVPEPRAAGSLLDKRRAAARMDVRVTSALRLHSAHFDKVGPSTLRRFAGFGERPCICKGATGFDMVRLN